jgi:hypothetical protein
MRLFIQCGYQPLFFKPLRPYMPFIRACCIYGGSSRGIFSMPQSGWGKDQE